MTLHRFTLWCRCGRMLPLVYIGTERTLPYAAKVQHLWCVLHDGEGHEVTADPLEAMGWAAERRETVS